MFVFVYPLVYFRSRSACDTYKQLVADAMNQLRALHRAGVTSNNQANQLDRLIKAVEQAKSRPIWTPNTTRQQQAELIEQLRRELNKVFTFYNILILVRGFVIDRFYRALLVFIRRWIRFAERTISNFCLQCIK